MDKGGFEAAKVTMWQTFSDPNLRTPTLLAIALMISQQFIGINAVNSYSGQLFGEEDSDKGLSQAQASEMINLTRLIGISFGIMFLKCMGRKTLLLFSQSVILVGLSIAWYLDTFEPESSLTIVGIEILILGF